MAAFAERWSRKQKPKKKKARASGLAPAALFEEGACVRLQAWARRLAARRHFLRCRKMHAYRSRVAAEVLSTEQTFVHVVGSVVQLFLEPLRQAGELEEAELRAIFSNVEIIAGINRTLLADLTARLDAWHINQCIGDVFMGITDFLKVYIDYVKNYEEAIVALEEAKERHSGLSKFLRDQMKKVKGYERDELVSLLITPVQRIPRYNLLLRDLLKHTWATHPDHGQLAAAMEKVRATAKVVNDKASEAENQTKVYALQSMMTGKFEALAAPGRRFVKDGELRLLDAAKKKRRRVYCMLFNDQIVCSKMETSKWRGTQKFEFLTLVPLAGATLVQLRSDPSGNSLQNAFSVETRKAKVLLQADSDKVRQEWVRELEAAIVETNANLSFIDAQKDTVAHQKADQARALIAEKYTRTRVTGSTEGDGEEGQGTGMRKFARKLNETQNMSVLDRLHRQECAEAQTEELLRQEQEQKDEKERQAQLKASDFKESAQRKYKDKPKTRKWTLTRKQGSEKAAELASCEAGALTPEAKAAVAKHAITEKYSTLGKDISLAEERQRLEAEEAAASGEEEAPKLRKWARRKQ